MTASLRILQVANHAGPFYVFLRPLTQALVENGMSVELACMPCHPCWEPLRACGVPVHSLPAGSWRNPTTWVRVYQRLQRLLDQGGYDLMVAHTPAMSWIARVAARRATCRTVYYAHGLPFSPDQPILQRSLYRFVETRLAAFTDAILVMNSDDMSVCRTTRLTRDGRHCYYVPGVGVDVARFDQSTSDARQAYEAHAAPRSGRPMVLFLGRFIRAKRPHDVLSIAEELKDYAEIVMAGDGPLWQSVHRRAARIGDHVRVLPFLKEPTPLFVRCSVVVLPSVFREGLPRVLLEAAAAGKPAVAYNVRGARDVIEHGKTGFLAPPKDVKAMTESVRTLLADSTMRQRMGQAARERVIARFSVKASVDAAIRAIQNLISSTGPESR